MAELSDPALGSSVSSVDIEEIKDELAAEEMNASRMSHSSAALLSPTAIIRRPFDPVFCIDEEEHELSKKYWQQVVSDEEL